MKKRLFHFPVIFLLLAFSGCNLDDDPEKNCNTPLIIQDISYPLDLYTGEEVESLYKSLNTSFYVKEICPDNLLLANATLTAKGTEFHEDVASIRFFWEYEPWITKYKDYIYLIQSPDNPNLYAASQLLLPYTLGFPLEFPAGILFKVVITFYDGMSYQEIKDWRLRNIDNIKFEVEGTRF